MDPENNKTPSVSNETPLQGWKEIGAYLEREPRTARRWELEEELPIRRHRTDRRSSVYAYPSELEAWRASRPAQAASTEPESHGRRVWIWAAIAAVCVFGALAILRQSRSLDTIAEAQSGEGGIRTTEVYPVADVGQFSPDGRYLSETDWTNSGEIGIRDLETNEYRRLGSKASWSEGAGEADKSIFSPDGKKIAYNWGSDRSGEFKYELRVIDAFGDSPQMRAVYSNPEFRYIEPSVWTGDNRLLVWFQRNDWSTGLGFVNIASGDLTVVRSFNEKVSAPVLSHDERWISYDIPEVEETARDVFVLAADGTSEFRVTKHRANDFVMGFAPGDATLLLASNRTGSYGLWGQRLVDARPNDEPTLLMRDIGTVTPMSVEPDGALVYVRAIGSVELMKAQIDINTGELLSRPSFLDTQYQGSNEGGAFLSPDGSRLVYKASPSRGVWALMVRDLSSGVERQVDTGGVTPEVYHSVAWSPDGKRLLTAGRDDQGRWSLVEIDVDKGGARAFRTGLDFPLRPIGWLPDNKTILYVHEEGRTSDGLEVKTVEKWAPGQTDAETLYSSKGKGSVNRILQARLSPQRDRIAWRELSDPSQIKVMSVGGEPRAVLEVTKGEAPGVAGLSWAPDGKSLILVRRATPNDELGNVELREVLVVPLEGGPPRKTELSVKGLMRAELHPDGKTIFFQAGSPDYRIFRTENYLPAHN